MRERGLGVVRIPLLISAGIGIWVAVVGVGQESGVG